MIGQIVHIKQLNASERKALRKAMEMLGRDEAAEAIKLDFTVLYRALGSRDGKRKPQDISIQSLNAIRTFLQSQKQVA